MEGEKEPPDYTRMFSYLHNLTLLLQITHFHILLDMVER